VPPVSSSPTLLNLRLAKAEGFLNSAQDPAAFRLPTPTTYRPTAPTASC